MNQEPFFNDARRRYAKYLAWALVVLTILLSDIFGFQLPISDGDHDQTLHEKATGDFSMKDVEGSSDSETVEYGITSIKGRGVISHELSTVNAGFCTIGEESTAADQVAAFCTIGISRDTVTVYVRHRDTGAIYDKRATAIHWLVVGER